MKTTTITLDQFIKGNYMNKLDFLSNVLEDFCSKNNLPFMSADDLLFIGTENIPNDVKIDSLTQSQQNWLNNYIEVWDLIQENT